MRTVKECVKKFFSVILCFLMNLIPEKKMDLKGIVGDANKEPFPLINYKNKYVEYLSEYIGVAFINKKSFTNNIRISSEVLFDDTG